MTDFQEPLSTVIDTDPSPSASGGGTPALEPVETPKDDKPASLRADLEAAFKEEAKPEPKAKEAEPKDGEEKPVETPEDAKAPAEKAEPPAKEGDEAPKAEAKEPDEKPEDKGRHVEPPKNFLPDSKEVWRNVPRAVRRDIENMTREIETEREHTKAVVDRYKAIEQFDELARSNGRDLQQSLHKIVEIEDALAANPIAGLNRILMEVGPRKADGQPLSLWEVANHIVQQGQQGYQQTMQQAQPQQQGPSEVDQLRQELAATKAEMKAVPIIERFALNNPRYYELQEDVALFLESGKISASLSPEDRLAAAYGMAERINPVSSASRASPSAEDQDDRRADEGFSGSKSIKSSPGSVTEEVDDRAEGGESIRDSILKADRRLRRA